MSSVGVVRSVLLLHIFCVCYGVRDVSSSEGCVLGNLSTGAGLDCIMAMCGIHLILHTCTLIGVSLSKPRTCQDYSLHMWLSVYL